MNCAPLGCTLVQGRDLGLCCSEVLFRPASSSLGSCHFARSLSLSSPMLILPLCQRSLPEPTQGTNPLMCPESDAYTRSHDDLAKVRR